MTMQKRKKEVQRTNINEMKLTTIIGEKKRDTLFHYT